MLQIGRAPIDLLSDRRVNVVGPHPGLSANRSFPGLYPPLTSLRLRFFLFIGISVPRDSGYSDCLEIDF